jgi:ATP-binding cassette subfamily A (ABC1) protein 3
MLVGFNVYLVNCRDNKYVSTANSIYAYGGPILYLCIQICFLSWYILWLEGGKFPDLFQHKHHLTDQEHELRPIAPEVQDEKRRVETDTSDPLRVHQLTKRFGHNLAVQDVSFGVGPGEVFALLGPNGAGKSTTIDMIRNELRPTEGDIYVEGMEMAKHARIARKHLGGMLFRYLVRQLLIFIVCPQFDALDLLTTREHLEFYARAKGISAVEQDVNTVMHKIGLEKYAGRLASKLSGGNKRKLTLAIALIGK